MAAEGTIACRNALSMAGKQVSQIEWHMHLLLSGKYRPFSFSGHTDCAVSKNLLSSLSGCGCWFRLVDGRSSISFDKPSRVEPLRIHQQEFYGAYIICLSNSATCNLRSFASFGIWFSIPTFQSEFMETAELRCWVKAGLRPSWLAYLRALNIVLQGAFLLGMTWRELMWTPTPCRTMILSWMFALKKNTTLVGGWPTPLKNIN